jgi:hypothetical protein
MTAPRFRIGWAMAFIAIVALELGAMRAIDKFRSPDMALLWLVQILGVGCQAMVNVLAVGFLFGYRWPRTRKFILGFEAFGAAALGLFIVGTIYFAEELRPISMTAVKPLVDLLRDGPYMSTAKIWLIYFILEVMLSLPQLAFAAIGGFLAHRRCVLGITAILAGPLVGASFAWLGIALGKMYAADVGVYTVLGAIIGLFTGITSGLVGLFHPSNPGGEDALVGSR